MYVEHCDICCDIFSLPVNVLYKGNKEFAFKVLTEHPELFWHYIMFFIMLIFKY